MKQIRRRLALRAVWALVAIAAAAVMVGALVAVGSQSRDIDRLTERGQRSKADRSDLRDQLEAQEKEAATRDAALEALTKQLKSLGEKPVVEPSELPDADDSPTTVVIEGTPGKRGKRGPGCVEEIGRERCKGDDSEVPGPSGTDGKDGADSTVPGPQGPAGKDGKDSTVPGPQGPQGEPGKSAYPFTFTFTVTDALGQPQTYTVTCTENGCSTT